MASLYRKAGTSKFHCSYLSRDGENRINRSTQESKRGKAMAQALAWEEEEQKIGGAVDAASSSILRLVADAGELARSRRLTVDRARQLISQMLEISAGDQLSTFTIGGWVDEWLLGKKGSVSESTYVSYRTAIKEFKRTLGERVDLPLEHLNESDMRRFRDNEKSRGKTSKTCNLRAKIISSAFRKAAQQGLITRNPAASLELLDEDDSTKRLPFNLKEIKSIMDVAPPDWQGMTLLGLYGGMRIRDASDLRWRNIDLTSKIITFTPRKTSRRNRVLVIPIHPTLVAYLLKRPSSDHPDDFLFPDLAGKGTGGRDGLSIQFVNLMKLADLEPKDSEKPDGSRDSRTVRERSFHSHSRVSTRLPLEDGRIVTVRKPRLPDAERERVCKILGIDWRRACPAVRSELKATAIL